MNYLVEQETGLSSSSFKGDYSTVNQTARVAVYDDLRSAPRVIEIKPAPASEFIESLAACINEQRLAMGGKIPYTIIREVAENFIHAQFREVVVSVMDQGNTIRFCDQGPGIEDKTHAILPGFTSATEEMKGIIRGVGSGLPIVKDYLDSSNGTLVIDDNLNTGAVVTISLTHGEKPQNTRIPMPPLTERERRSLQYFYQEGVVGNKELAEYFSIAASSAAAILKRLTEYGYIEKTYKRKYMLTDLGSAISKQL